ncbi:MAG: hypothetical protein MHM6MM_002395 [Cercozoa sp. M6MM]
MLGRAAWAGVTSRATAKTSVLGAAQRRSRAVGLMHPLRTIAPTRLQTGSNKTVRIETPDFSQLVPTTESTWQQVQWNRHRDRRVGLIGRKCGVIQLWDNEGYAFPCTVIAIDMNQVTNVRLQSDGKNGHLFGVQVGAGTKPPKAVGPAEYMESLKSKVPPKRVLHEFKVTEPYLLPIGTELSVRQFTVGQKVETFSKSKGKGFQGVMKRWGFAGQPATHGNSKAHRKPGSIATGTAIPSRVMKGKKMPGRMGGKVVNMKGLRVFRIDPARNLLYLKGAVPGHNDCWVVLRDYHYDQPENPPTPAFLHDPEEDWSTLETQTEHVETSRPDFFFEA